MWTAVLTDCYNYITYKESKRGLVQCARDRREDVPCRNVL